MKTDSWKRPIEEAEEYNEIPTQLQMNFGPREATPEEMAAWRQEDYWNRGDYDPLVMFVVIPTIVQVMCMGMMFAVMYLNSIIF